MAEIQRRNQSVTVFSFSLACFKWPNLQMQMSVYKDHSRNYPSSRGRLCLDIRYLKSPETLAAAARPSPPSLLSKRIIIIIFSWLFPSSLWDVKFGANVINHVWKKKKKKRKRGLQSAVFSLFTVSSANFSDPRDALWRWFNSKSYTGKLTFPPSLRLDSSVQLAIPNWHKKTTQGFHFFFFFFFTRPLKSS